MQISLSSSPRSLPACDLPISMATPTGDHAGAGAAPALVGPSACCRSARRTRSRKGRTHGGAIPATARSIALPEALRNLEDEERAAFWPKASLSLEGGRLSYAAVRKVMQDTLTLEHLRQSKRSVKGPFHGMGCKASTPTSSSKRARAWTTRRALFFLPPSLWPLATHARRCWARCTAVRSCTWRRSRFSGPWSRRC